MSAYFGEPLTWFSWMMGRKLQANQHKSTWKGMSPKALLLRLRQETGELSRAIADEATPETIINEAADVANFAMMIADNARSTSQR